MKQNPSLVVAVTSIICFVTTQVVGIPVTMGIINPLWVVGTGAVSLCAIIVVFKWSNRELERQIQEVRNWRK